MAHYFYDYVGDNKVRVLDTLDFVTEVISRNDFIEVFKKDTSKFVGNSFNLKTRLEFKDGGYISMPDLSSIVINYKDITTCIYLISVSNYFFICKDDYILYYYGANAFETYLNFTDAGIFVSSDYLILRFKYKLESSSNDFLDVKINIKTGNVYCKHIYSTEYVEDITLDSSLRNILQFDTCLCYTDLLKFIASNNDSYKRAYCEDLYGVVLTIYKRGIFSVRDIKQFLKSVEKTCERGVNTGYIIEALKFFSTHIPELTEKDVLFATRLHFLYGGDK